MPLSESQLRIAAIIVRVGHDLGATEEQITAALAGAWVESRFGKLDGGDNGTAWGIFQQRPVAGWGNKSLVEDPYYAAKAFYLGTGPHKGLLDVWKDSRSPGLNVQAVQSSAFPDRYDAEFSYAQGVLTLLKRAVGISDIGGERNVSSPEELPPSLQPNTDRGSVPTKPSPPPKQSSNVARILVLSVGLVLILLALGHLSNSGG